ncbi:MAG: hypothetical protein ACLGSA_16610 [Acidobacteriota bacterium]
MKQFTLILLMLGVVLVGLTANAQARGMGMGHRTSNANCPAWSNVSSGNGGMPMMRNYAMAAGPGHSYGHGYGRGHVWTNGTSAASGAGQSAPATSGQSQQ